ncbi:MAG TPA: outer membrane lipoprotein chaperone LolA [Thermomonas sp.]|jgi:outer membrane lipoprotein carrier protein|uniref:outer membrane lipoprotein chaperone LolA n=1 Tax=Thermomonas sp. TaxID=1971895 RepID=UPI002B870C67|nr:outer membrane lipoprotein chaperone LolA [Thermomonas sp.]HOV95303.1 outer membrane lipoprotein chaperone LolA [Thermomonas sp.]
MKPTAAIFTITLLLSANWANAGARDALNSFSKDLKGLDGQFNQQVYAPGGKLKERSSGRVAVAAPKQFRWEYVKPYAQLIVADGTAVWVYDPDLSQVSKRAQGAEEANSPLALLLDPVKLERSFVSKEQATQNGVEWLQITPRNADAAFKSARLGFAAGNLAQLEYMDALGQRTVIVFTAWKRNPAFAKGTFEFTPAKGVDVIGG